MNRLRRFFHRRHDYQPFELTEDYLPVTATNELGVEYSKLRDEGPKVWYVGFACVKCGQPGFKQGPLL